MPYNGNEFTGREAVQVELTEGLSADFFNSRVPDPKTREFILKHATRAWWEHSAFKDPGPDWNKLHIELDTNETRVYRQEGY